MRIIFLIASKDFKQIASSPIFFFIAALCTILWSVTFVNFLNQFGVQSMMASNMQGGGEGPNIIRSVFMPHVSVVNLIFIITLPALTMRLIAEEKKTRSYDLLLTAPITATQIVVGKFFAGLAATLCLLILSLLYPLATDLIADFNWGMVLTIYLGMFLIAALYTAAGLLASSLTESAMLAVFMGVVFNLFIWFIGPSGADAEIEWVAKFMEYINLGKHMTNFISGSLQISSTIFFVSTIGFFIFLSQRVVESSRWR
jgi:ABC-2 type transport system permease protein